MRINEGDIYEYYEFRVISFRLTNALIIFLDLMNIVFKEILITLVIVFIDDILVCSKFEEELEMHLMKVLMTLIL